MIKKLKIKIITKMIIIWNLRKLKKKQNNFMNKFHSFKMKEIILQKNIVQKHKQNNCRNKKLLNLAK